MLGPASFLSISYFPTSRLILIRQAEEKVAPARGIEACKKEWPPQLGSYELLIGALGVDGSYVIRSSVWAVGVHLKSTLTILQTLSPLRLNGLQLKN